MRVQYLYKNVVFVPWCLLFQFAMKAVLSSIVNSNESAIEPSAHTGPRLLLDSTNAEAGYKYKKGCNDN